MIDPGKQREMTAMATKPADKGGKAAKPAAAAGKKATPTAATKTPPKSKSK